MNDLTQIEVKELFHYNNGQLFWKKTLTNRAKIGNRAGTLGSDNYRRIGINGKSYLESRLIFLWFNGIFPQEIDHINRISNDNRIENLRSVNRQENNWNRGGNKKATSKYKGVSFDKVNSMWRATIKKNGKWKNLGRYETEVEACQVYNKMARAIFGEYAYINKIGSN